MSSKNASRPKRFWRIRGYNGFDEFLDIQVPVGCLSDANLQQLLRCFAAKAGLSYQEIVGGYVKRGTRSAHELLHIQKNGPYPEYNCGNDPSFVAIVVGEDGRRVEYPPI